MFCELQRRRIQDTIYVKELSSQSLSTILEGVTHMIKQVKTKKIYEIVAEQLTEMIVNGDYEPGERLGSVQKLSEDFDVGRSAIREALSALKAMGLIEIRQGEGTFVKHHIVDVSKEMIPNVMERNDLIQLFEVRKLNETGAAALAASNRDEDDLTNLQTILDEMKLNEGDGVLGEQADIRFHMAIVAAAKNPMLERLMETISETVKESMKEARQLFLYTDEEKMKQLYNEHVQIFEAIKAQDSSAAYEAMYTHLAGVEKEIFLKEERE
ncbi:GntR family transcriptional regulator [Salisediminibacterium halotolerans]|nr:GntR family transcriptional regulator [Actinophytocola xinjiangensis]RPE88682.1 GntR family transcriptional regulator [Salisediminibacterium halotolerans]TWG36957.1 GntR family transcriptional regulator [Salisediminibacterium halotolerans]GEL08430.1 HTH-type transcriptional regulator LutR [Salisediminibacterium halotolerans]